MNKWISIAISALTTFIITAGTGYTTIVTGTTASPDTAQIITCIVGGFITAARDIQKNMNPPPQ